MRLIIILAFATLFLTTSGVSQNVTMLPYHRFAVPVVVNIQQPWTDTGINLAVNDTVEIIVEGIASTQGAANSTEVAWTGPEGDGTSVAPSTFNAPGVAPQSVIGRIGTSGTGFYVGSTRALKANVSGRLYLGYNDDPSRPWPENFGYYVAFVMAPSTFAGIVEGVRNMPMVPQSVAISQNYPNPFNPATQINFRLPARGNVTIMVYNSQGQVVRTLLDEQREAGEYSITWDGKNDQLSVVSSGAYFYQIKAGNSVQTKKMLLLK